MGAVRRHPLAAVVSFVALLGIGFVAGCAIVVWRAAHHDDASELDQVDAIVEVPEGHTTLESLQAAAKVMRDGGLVTAFLVSDPWHNARVERMAKDLGIDGHASATWQSAAISQDTRLEGYVRETLAYLYYRVVGR